MATLNIKDFPEELMEKLKDRSHKQQRSVRGEVIHILTGVLDTQRAHPQSALMAIEEIRKSYRPQAEGATTDEMLAEDRAR